MSDVAQLSDTQHIVNRVLEYRHPGIRDRLVERYGWAEDVADAIFDETKKFLYLCATVPGRWQPSSAIDKCWHEFLLWSRDYAKFCETHFGRFIHHQPEQEVASQTFSERVEITKAAACELFGELSEYWEYDEETVKIRDAQPTQLRWSSCYGGC